MKNLLFLFLPLLIIGCKKDDDGGTNPPIEPVYSVTFNALVCDTEIDITCTDESSKTIAPNVNIFLFESEQARELHQQIVSEGKTDINGQITFGNLPSGDYFYSAVHPDPNSVTEEIVLHFVRISPNTTNNKEEVLFQKL